jgi:AraC family transcriptional regulator, arabinose operon regulatory protein
VISDHQARRSKNNERMSNGLEYSRDASALPIFVTTSGSGYWGPERFFQRHHSEITGLELAVAGDVAFTQNGREYMIRPGDVYLLRKGAQHLYKTGPSGYIVKRYLTLEGPVLDQVIQSVGLQSYDVVRPANIQAVRRCFKRINTLLDDKPPSFAISASASAFELLMELGRSVQPQLPAPVRLSLEFMQRNLNKNLESADFARAARLSVTHFNRQFRAHIGSSPKAYFNHRRMEWARHLLQSTSLSIKEIAVSVGFEDPFYFSARFKNAMGKSPRESRNK